MSGAPLLKHALDCAAVWHVDQKRKYPSASVPYMSHVAGVAATLSRHGFDAPVAVADKIDNFQSIIVSARVFGPDPC